GVEVDFDLTQPLDGADAQAFRDLFFRESLLLFRGQTLTMDEQQRVIEYIGPVLPGSGKGFLSPEDKVLGTVKLDYHSDLCATPMPLDAISLHALDVVEGTSTTNFVSGVRAYAKLPDALRQRIEGLDVNFVQTLADRSRLTYDVAPDALNLVRPFVMRHRITGTPLVYANESSAARVEGLGREESAELIDAVFAILYDPSNEIRHSWRNGDFIVWDNLALQHGRPPLDPGIPRHMQRVTSGRKTLREQVPNYNLSGVFGED
ncbi:MAG: TauD/TfdA family dioxygenase, partial [Sphingomonadales bacterium]